MQSTVSENTPEFLTLDISLSKTLQSLTGDGMMLNLNIYEAAITLMFCPGPFFCFFHDMQDLSRASLPFKKKKKSSYEPSRCVYMLYLAACMSFRGTSYTATQSFS